MKPDAPEPYFNRATARHTRGELTEALADFGKAIHGYPRYEEGETSLETVNSSRLAALISRGLTYRDLGDPAHAQVNFETALAMNKNYFPAIINLGIVLKEQGDLARALECLDHAASLKPTSALPYVNRGTVLDKVGRVAAAISDYDQAIALDPGLVEAYVNRHCTNGPGPLPGCRRRLQQSHPTQE